jgi:hypothetical protein
VKIQGSAHATTLYLKGLVYHGGYHFTCQIIMSLEIFGFMMG